DEIFEMFSPDNVMHHSDDTHLAGGRRNNFDSIQAQMIVVAQQYGALNQGSNLKIGTVNDEFKAASKSSSARQIGAMFVGVFQEIAESK
ncbi:MAG: hypothetical protein ACK5XV_01570, partial [Flavobacteriales bacterium]